jgi:hypothetical protein
VYWRATVTNNRTSTSRFHSLHILAHDLPADPHLATVSRTTTDQVILTGFSPIPPPPVPPPLPASLADILAGFPVNDRWAVHSFRSFDDGHSLATAILQGKATAVSDGSFKEGIGTSGFILRGCHRVLAATGSNIVPGNRQEQSSYRSELAGISGAVCGLLGQKGGILTTRIP